MTEKITDETMDYVSILAKLSLSEEEREEAKKDMEKMLNYIDILQELDTEGIEPSAHVFPIYNVMREDESFEKDTSELLKNAPKEKDGCIVVPKTIGTEA